MKPIEKDYDARLRHATLAIPRKAHRTPLSLDIPPPSIVQSNTSAVSSYCDVLAVVITVLTFPATTTKTGVGQDAIVAAASAVHAATWDFTS